MSDPLVVGDRAALETALAPVRAAGAEVALVPTMGALHGGHASLVRRAREEVGPSGVVVVSVFVNPLQFGVGEDLDRYPRTLDADVALCAREGADLVLAPAYTEVYPGGEPQVTVHPGPLGDELEGAVRPGHFRGVLTVVAKLFGLTRPDVAVFGQKDYQQLVLVRAMVADLCLPLRIVGAPTVREDDGLALSSRNSYLDGRQRQASTVLSRALLAGAEAGGAGADAVLLAAASPLAAAEANGDLVLDYLELRGPDLGPAPAAGEARLLVAARVGATRLIDNTAVHLGST